MKKLATLILALIGATQVAAVNDALWAGTNKYSVTLQYGSVVESGVDRPLPKSVQMPDYPIEAMKAGVSGDASILFLVGADGAVRDVVVEKASIVGFGVAAQAAVAKWTFFPSVLLKDRKKIVPAHIRCRFEFKASES
jgi:TonB family protein